jgi:hypothetical protein
MTDDPDAKDRYNRMGARAEILIPAIKRMLDETGSSHEEVAATLRLYADLVEGKTDPGEEIAKVLAEKGVSLPPATEAEPDE